MVDNTCLPEKYKNLSDDAPPSIRKKPTSKKRASSSSKLKANATNGTRCEPCVRKHTACNKERPCDTCRRVGKSSQYCNQGDTGLSRQNDLSDEDSDEVEQEEDAEPLTKWEMWEDPKSFTLPIRMIQSLNAENRCGTCKVAYMRNYHYWPEKGTVENLNPFEDCLICRAEGHSLRRFRESYGILLHEALESMRKEKQIWDLETLRQEFRQWYQDYYDKWKQDMVKAKYPVPNWVATDCRCSGCLDSPHVYELTKTDDNWKEIFIEEKISLTSENTKLQSKNVQDHARNANPSSKNHQNAETGHTGHGSKKRHRHQGSLDSVLSSKRSSILDQNHLTVGSPKNKRTKRPSQHSPELGSNHMSRWVSLRKDPTSATQEYRSGERSSEYSSSPEPIHVSTQRSSKIQSSIRDKQSGDARQANSQGPLTPLSASNTASENRAQRLLDLFKSLTGMIDRLHTQEQHVDAVLGLVWLYIRSNADKTILGMKNLILSLSAAAGLRTEEPEEQGRAMMLLSGSEALTTILEKLERDEGYAALEQILSLKGIINGHRVSENVDTMLKSLHKLLESLEDYMGDR